MADPIRAVLIDMGGVLLDFGPADGLPHGRADFRGREALLALLREGGNARLDHEDLDALLFLPWRAEYERRYERGREADWHPHLARLRRQARRRFSDLRLLSTWFGPFAETVTPLGDGAATLAALTRQGVALALVSNVPLPGAVYRPILARAGLLAPLRSVHFSYDEGSRKPSPAMLLRALGALGVRPEEAVMVGDRRKADVAAGRLAGVRTVWLRSSDGGGPAPDRTLERLGDLPALVAAWT